jgi:hypothetical protein
MLMNSIKQQMQDMVTEYAQMASIYLITHLT